MQGVRYKSVDFGAGNGPVSLQGNLSIVLEQAIAAIGAQSLEQGRVFRKRFKAASKKRAAQSAPPAASEGYEPHYRLARERQ